MGIYSTVAGIADNAAGSVDESIGRQFDDEPGGGFADITESGESNHDGWAGGGEDSEYHNRYLQGETVRTVYDTIFEYSGTLNGREDTADVFGPSVGGVVDAAVTVEGEETDGEERKAKLWIYGAVLLVVLYLAAPLLQVVAGVTDG